MITHSTPTSRSRDLCCPPDEKSRSSAASVTPRRSPEFVIVIPVYGHAVLVTEAIASAVHESRCANGAVVIVNDGCLFQDTHATCLALAAACPDVIDYIRTPNAGLSAARNRGIRHALARFPGAEAIYFLDADNRISPGAMRRALGRLREAGADWVFPNIDKFGFSWSGDFSAPHSRLRNLFQNSCEAGSLVHRRVFEAGVFFDEEMRSGYEDWEFWLQCIAAGFRGVPCANFGFQYRARRESMLRDSDRDAAAILAYMHRKHRSLFSSRNLLRLEHTEAPRYCIVDWSRRRYRYTSTPHGTTRSGHRDDLEDLFWNNHSYPTHVHFPQFVVFADEQLLDDVATSRMIDCVFWHIEDALASEDIVAVTFQHDAERETLGFHASATSQRTVRDRAHILATTRPFLAACTLGRETAWVDALHSGNRAPTARHVEIRGAVRRSTLNALQGRAAVHGMFGLLQALWSSASRATVEPRWEWRQADALTPLASLHADVRSHLRAMAPLARTALSNRPEIAFVVPLCSFGGVEQVAIAVAREVRAAGWTTRLVVTQSNVAAVPSRLVDAFDCLLFLDDESYGQWNQSGLVYYGHDLQQWPIHGRHDRLCGLLAGCAAVVNLHALHGHEIMGWLRRQGVVTVASLHLLDQDSYGAPTGHPYVTLAYEHAYDFVTAPSRQLLDVCAGLGMPREKLLHLPNAGSFVPSPEMVQRRRARLARDDYGAVRPLNVLCLGRLDRQKGMERVFALRDMTRDGPLRTTWRVVGGSVVDELPGTPPSGGTNRTDFEPPVYDRQRVADLLLWADVLLILSRWEGSPLVILEAQAMGVVPLATDVGAVAEMIDDGETGILIPDGTDKQVAAAAYERLSGLYHDPASRRAMALLGMASSSKKTWHTSVQPLLRAVSARLA